MYKALKPFRFIKKRTLLYSRFSSALQLIGETEIQIELEFGNVGFEDRGENGVPEEKLNLS